MGHDDDPRKPPLWLMVERHIAAEKRNSFFGQFVDVMMVMTVMTTVLIVGAICFAVTVVCYWMYMLIWPIFGSAIPSTLRETIALLFKF